MQFNVTLDDQTTALTVTRGDDGRLAIAMPDREMAVTCRRIDEHHLFLTIDGVGCNAFVSGDGHNRKIVINGVSCEVSDADEAARYAPAGAAARALPREVTPPMPAVVVKIMVAADQQVRQGESLVVVSAMKMETSLTAPFDARVVRINTAVGDKVMPGDILVDLEAVEADEMPEK
jgi:3-methylcrotonyl-CoA carboxylase alpha subunit